MVSFVVFTTLAIATVAAGSADIGQNAQISVDSLQVGDFYHPSSDEVTGYADSTSPVPFRQSPCPDLNALANHGHIPRSGKDVTHESLGNALMSVFNFDNNLTQTLLNQVPATFSLDIISRHNVLEHDASLVHNDEYFGGDPVNMNETMVDNLLGRSLDGKTLGVTEVGETRKDRLAEYRANKPRVRLRFEPDNFLVPRGCRVHRWMRRKRERVGDPGSRSFLCLGRTYPRQLRRVCGANYSDLHAVCDGEAVGVRYFVLKYTHP